MPEGKAPPIGRFRNFTKVFEWRDVPDPSGPEVYPNYVPVGQCWSALKEKADMALLGAALSESPLPSRSGSHTVRTRFRQDLTVRHMLEIEGKRYRIVSVQNDDARRYTMCEVEEFGDMLIIATDPRPDQGLPP
jgi:Phage head-tail joining protein